MEIRNAAKMVKVRGSVTSTDESLNPALARGMSRTNHPTLSLLQSEMKFSIYITLTGKVTFSTCNTAVCMLETCQNIT